MFKLEVLRGKYLVNLKNKYKTVGFISYSIVRENKNVSSINIMKKFLGKKPKWHY